MIQAFGTTYAFEISTANLLTIKKGGKAIVLDKPIESVKILFFNEKNAVGAGQIALYIEGMDKSIVDSFRKDTCANFKDMYSHLSMNCSNLNLSFLQASSYIPAEKKQERTQQIKDKKAEAKAYQERLGATIEQTPKLKPSLFSRIGAKKQRETECTCAHCKTVWFVNDAQVMRYAGNVLSSVGNLLAGNATVGAYHLNSAHDIFQCPQCGSKKIRKKDVVFWVDKHGDYIE